jgi:hypothetical protein
MAITIPTDTLLLFSFVPLVFFAVKADPSDIVRPIL